LLLLALLYSVPEVTTAVPAAVSVPSYVLVTSDVLTVMAALLIVLLVLST